MGERKSVSPISVYIKDTSLAEKASKILESIGMSLSAGVRMFLYALVKNPKRVMTALVDVVLRHIPEEIYQSEEDSE